MDFRVSVFHPAGLIVPEPRLVLSPTATPEVPATIETGQGGCLSTACQGPALTPDHTAPDYAAEFQICDTTGRGANSWNGISALLLQLAWLQGWRPWPRWATRLRDCLETLLWRPSDGVFCASGAHGPKCPLRAGSRNHHHMTRQSEFRNSLLSL
jgi:hypothetical protein